ncbi:MAG: sugar transporter permease, partial [Devosia sp.]|nr:sugar transporter permease [Devosia sp.]
MSTVSTSTNTLASMDAAQSKALRRARRRAAPRTKWVVPTLYIIFLLLPIYWLINMSFKTNTEITSSFTLFPHDFTLHNYTVIFTDPSWY